MILRGKLTQYGPQNRATLFAPGNPTERHSKTDLVVDYKKSRTIKNCYPFYLEEKKSQMLPLAYQKQKRVTIYEQRMGAHIYQDKGPIIKDAKRPYAFLYSWKTNNGRRPTVLLELLGIDYYLHPVDLDLKVQKEDWYLEKNANGKIPTLAWVDKKGDITYVNESAAILLFLADKYDKSRKFSFRPGSKEYYLQLEWLFFELSGFCPYKSNWRFFHNLPERNETAVSRFRDESIRRLKVLEARLNKTGTRYLVGDHLSLADITLYTWIRPSQMDTYEEVIESLPNIKNWILRIGNIPQIKKGLAVFD